MCSTHPLASKTRDIYTLCILIRPTSIDVLFLIYFSPLQDSASGSFVVRRPKSNSPTGTQPTYKVVRRPDSVQRVYPVQNSNMNVSFIALLFGMRTTWIHSIIQSFWRTAGGFLISLLYSLSGFHPNVQWESSTVLWSQTPRNANHTANQTPFSRAWSLRDVSCERRGLVLKA